MIILILIYILYGRNEREGPHAIGDLYIQCIGQIAKPVKPVNYSTEWRSLEQQ